jgi:hypothetical protein
MRKSVSFGSSTEAYKPCEVVDCEALWYSKSELANLKLNGLRLVEEMVGVDEDDVGDSLRGLEHFQDGSGSTRHRRHEYVKSVLALQMEMKEMNVNDPKGIQAFASAHTSRDCKDARRRGKIDAAVAGNKESAPRKHIGLRSMSPQKTIGASCA